MKDASDIVLTYADADRSRAQRLAEALEGQGWTVSWDRSLGAVSVAEYPPESLMSARCIVVLWSSLSINSPEVRDQARRGLKRQILVSAFIDEVTVPEEFRHIQSADLIDWEGDDRALAFLRLVLTITSIVEPCDVGLSRGGDGPSTEPSAKSDYVYDEHVQFTVYRPNAVLPGQWSTMLAFAHLSEAQSEDEPDPLQEVERQAQRILAEQYDDFSRSAQDASQAVPREGTLSFIPAVLGVEFNPPSRSFVWHESIHREEFRLRAAANLEGQTARGRLSVYLGAILIAEVNLTFRVRSASGQAAPATRASAEPFRKIFPSYSHRDKAIVGQFKAYATSLGDDYLQDVAVLRAGEVWGQRIQEFIADADIFQLFWSRHAMASPYVEQEWRFALGLNRPNLIRPIYWEQPLPRRANPDVPPAELSRLHFQFIGIRPGNDRNTSDPAATDDNTAPDEPRATRIEPAKSAADDRVMASPEAPSASRSPRSGVVLAGLLLVLGLIVMGIAWVLG